MTTTPLNDLKSRLLDKVKPNCDTGCWEWTAAKLKCGYGIIATPGRINKLAHRVSYELHCGEIPDGLFVCHTCDNRTCINPSHLFVGTNAENMADMRAKGRQRRGVTQRSAKLTEADVIAIRAADGVLHRDLAQRYGVDKSQISCIRSGKYWSHVGGSG